MKRKDFLKQLGFAGVTAVAAPIFIHCRNDETEGENGTVTTGNSTTTGCVATNSETEGPYPTKNPSTLVKTDIVGDRTGIPLSIAITIQNTNAACATLQNAIVDIWQCDRDGNYSEYSSFTSSHFLRGRQTTDANGLVNFTSIFPGWYSGRATHIHVHVYNAKGNSLLVTQIAFPADSDSAVVKVNATSGYKGMNGYTYNESDNVFSDGYTNELCSLSGNTTDGYALTHVIKVSA